MVTRLSHYDRGFGQYSDARALTTRGLKVENNPYPSAPHVITSGGPVPSGFLVIPLFFMPIYAGVAAGWCGDQDGPGRANAENMLRRFEMAVSWEYAWALVRIRLAEVRPNARVPIGPITIISCLQERRRVLPSDERADDYWGLRIDPPLLYFTQAPKAPINRQVPDGRSLRTVTIA